MIYFDITRLTSRLDATSPTGIDRVELHYALFFLEQNAFFVIQRSNFLVHLPTRLASEIITYLYEYWSASIPESVVPAKKLATWLAAQPMPKRIENTDHNFIKDLKKMPFRERLRATLHVKEAIAKKAKLVPWPISCFFCALLPSVVLRYVKPSFPARPDSQLKFFEKENFYVNVGHTGLMKKKFFSMLHKTSKLKTVFYIHDILPITHAKYYPIHQKDQYHKQLHTLTAYGDYLFANSQFTKNEFIRVTKTNKIINVLEIGCSLFPNTRRTSNRSGFVAIGTIEPRKNYLWLTKAWLSFCAIYPQLVTDEKLTIFGKEGWLDAKSLKKFKILVQGSPRIEWIVGASDKTMQHRVQEARACLAAAEVEGWGMPVVESLALGTPVIAYSSAAHREATKGKAYFFSSYDERELHNILLKSYEPKEYEKMLKLTQEFIPWSWETHFNDFLVHLGVSSHSKRKEVIRD